jgi:hypothetical protein
MLSPHRSSRRPVAFLLVIAASAIALTAAGRTMRVTPAGWTMRVTPTARPAASCATAEFRQFDFFAGDWDTYDVADPSKLVARNRVTVVLDGCAVREVYEQGDGLVGESLSIYDASRRRWHQSWVTNRGSLLLLNGGLEGERMVLSGPDRAADGTPSVLRAIWWKEGADVREKAERSTDGGKTWTPVFDIVFRSHRQQRESP